MTSREFRRFRRQQHANRAADLVAIRQHPELAAAVTAPGSRIDEHSIDARKIEPKSIFLVNTRHQFVNAGHILGKRRPDSQGFAHAFTEAAVPAWWHARQP